ncbi:hypothetical protein OH77DRAFT_1042688 [Trametes cingulata]|nr:hypothetical protein OH77DRAFT_1042688 [Trametes cingulata]
MDLTRGSFVMEQCPPFVRRHQVFLVAYVQPREGPRAYRCVAAFHHDYSYGSIALRSAYRFLKTTSMSDNESVIRAELQELDGKYGRPGDADDGMPKIPCPYTAYLLGTSWTTHLDDSTGDMSFNAITLTLRILDVNMSCRAFPNDDGITVIDITFPTRPAYCMMVLSEPGAMTPLSAKEYLEAYYPLDEEGAAVRYSRLYRWSAELAFIPLLTASALREAWPAEVFNNRRTGDADVADASQVFPGPFHDFSHFSWAVEYLLLISEMLAPDALPSYMASLSPEAHRVVWERTREFWHEESEHCLNLYPDATEFGPIPVPPFSPANKQTLEQFLADPEATIEGAVAMLEDPVQAFHAKQLLRTLSPFPNHALDILLHALKEVDEERSLDLARFSLTIDQLMQLIASYSNYGLEALDISFNPLVTLSDITLILHRVPSLLRLNVIGCKKLRDRARILHAISQPVFRTLEGLHHPSLLGVLKLPSHPVAFTFLHGDDYLLTDAGLPLFTPTQVFQGLVDMLPYVWRDRNHLSARHEADHEQMTAFLASAQENACHTGTGHTMPTLCHAILSRGSRRPGQRWSESAVVSVPQHPFPAIAWEPEGNWAFCLLQRRDTGRKWGFVHYAGSDAERYTRTFTRQGIVYDLRGFLRCMAEEGRPLPPSDLAAELEAILYEKDSTFAGADYIFQLMSECDAPKASKSPIPIPLTSLKRNKELGEKYTGRAGLSVSKPLMMYADPVEPT